MSELDVDPIRHSNTDSSASSNDGNKYLSKKTIAQGMFDVALLSSNTNQLVHLLEIQTTDYEITAFHTTAIVLLILSIVLQVIVGACLIYIAITNPRKRTRKDTVRRLNNIATILIFCITVINVMIPPFTPSYNYTKKPIVVVERKRK